ncbi:hypothetical protein AB0P44_45280, partial [Streptomyces chartreusis]|uniref:hypothetical protein n=1 Tax=Streptomyces chartreusis TaxID=1969 RepID=UPI0034455F27
RPNISGKMFDQRSYGTDPATGLIDYEALRASAPGHCRPAPGRGGPDRPQPCQDQPVAVPFRVPS